jgi:signal transduction histidine kinase
MLARLLRRLVPQSLAGRTILTLLVGLSASHLVSLVVFTVGETGAPACPDPSHVHPFWAGYTGISSLVMAAAILLLSFWVVRRLTRPLSEVAAAAERLGQGVDAPPLAETGSLEVRLVARAFNSMQERLRRFVEDRTRMLAAISHDLRTPITLLRLRTEFIGDPEEQARMRATLDEMEAMIAATLSFARDDATSEPRLRVDLVGLLSSICYDLADAGLPVSFEPTGRLPFECRPAALKRALTNLIENGVKYGHTARVALSALEANIRITVEDDGPGIPAAEQENVFAPFYRLESSRNTSTGGVGLGLSVARTVIHGHGGEVCLRNRPEGGLRAEVTLPYPVAPRAKRP